MASTQQIRDRIRSVRNTRQITKAMQMVSASKLRRLQDAATATQAYSKYAREILANLGAQQEARGFVFYKERPVKRRMLIVVTSNRGLAGAYNSNILKKYLAELKSDRDNKLMTTAVVIGRQGSKAISRLKDADVTGVYINLPDRPTIVDIKAAIDSSIEEFVEGTVDAVDIIYTQYVNTVTQHVALQRLLPAGFSDEPVSKEVLAAVFEPSAEAVLESTTIRLLEAQVLQAVIESSVSEQAMRMLAMKSATDNANDLIDAYSLAYNNARQAAITQELAEISGGAEAMK